MTDVFEHKCPNCGGAVKFDSTAQKMVCPFCDSEFNVDALREYDEEMRGAAKDSYGWDPYGADSGGGDWKEGELDGLHANICQSCGGEIIGDRSLAATTCPYCGNHAIITGAVSGMFRPDYIIPFKLEKEAAIEKLRSFIRRKPLLPSLFKDKNKIESLMGIYEPFWLFDCDIAADANYKATKVHRWSDGQYHYTRTDHYSLYRAARASFERVPQDGSSKADDTYMEAIEPYDYSEIKPFQTAYLSGYLADKYDVDAEAAKPRANDRVKRSAEAMLRETVSGYSSVVPERGAVNFSNGSVRYALMPVWMMSTEYGGKLYQFAMNGQTGRFVGELPTSRGKLLLWFFGLLIGLSAVGSGLVFLFCR